MNKNNKKGFTLAELLIVVAIIGVLVAVSIPIFTAQLKKARLATNQANARAGYAAAVAEYLSNDAVTGGTYYTGNSTFVGGTVGGTNTNSIDIASWNLTSEPALGNTVYKQWGIGLNNGTVTQIAYGN